MTDKLFCEECKQDHNQHMDQWCDRSTLEIKYDKLKKDFKELESVYTKSSILGSDTYARLRTEAQEYRNVLGIIEESERLGHKMAYTPGERCKKVLDKYGEQYEAT